MWEAVIGLKHFFNSGWKDVQPISQIKMPFPYTYTYVKVSQSVSDVTTVGKCTGTSPPKFTTEQTCTIQQGIPNLCKCSSAMLTTRSLSSTGHTRLTIIDTSFRRFLHYSTKFRSIQAIDLRSTDFNWMVTDFFIPTEIQCAPAWMFASAIRAKLQLPCTKGIMGLMPPRKTRNNAIHYGYRMFNIYQGKKNTVSNGLCAACDWKRKE